MRVAHFIHRYPPALGGSEAYFARLSRYLVSRGDQVSVFTTVANDVEAFWSPRGRCFSAGTFIEDGVEVRRYPLWRCRGRRYLLKPLSLIPIPRWQCRVLPCNPISWQMARAASQEPASFDVVHASAFPYGWPIACGLKLARRLRIPCVLTPFLHLGDPANPRDPVRRAYTSRALRYLLHAADRILVQTAGERDVLRDHGIAPDKICLQGLGVEPAECTGGDRSRSRKAWGASDEEVVIGHLANQSREKGTIDLLQAANRLWEQGSPFRLVLAGPEMPNFQAFWRSYQPRGPVIRLGVLDEDEKRDFFAGLDMFALPSRSDSFGLVLLEAWANGVPNVAYRAGGIAEVVRHEEDGLLAPCGDIAGLSAFLNQLIQTPALRSQLGQAGYRRTIQEFQWATRLQRVRDLYRSLTEGRSRGPRPSVEAPTDYSEEPKFSGCSSIVTSRSSGLP